jgi:hypothetical protein
LTRRYTFPYINQLIKENSFLTSLPLYQLTNKHLAKWDFIGTLFPNAICSSTSLNSDNFDLRLGLTFSSFATSYKIMTTDFFLPCILHISGLSEAGMAQSV